MHPCSSAHVAHAAQQSAVCLKRKCRALQPHCFEAAIANHQQAWSQDTVLNEEPPECTTPSYKEVMWTFMYADSTAIVADDPEHLKGAIPVTRLLAHLDSGLEGSADWDVWT